MNYRTALGRARGLGSAGQGARHWWWQRVTAVLLILPVFWLTATVIQLPKASYGDALAWVKAPWNTFLLIAVIGVALFHATLGLHVIIEDYVHVKPLKVLGVAASSLLCGSLALAAVLATLRIFLMN